MSETDLRSIWLNGEWLNGEEQKAMTTPTRPAPSAESGEYVLVPRDLTDAMLAACWPLWHPHEGRTKMERRPEQVEMMRDQIGGYYRAMIATAIRSRGEP